MRTAHRISLSAENRPAEAGSIAIPLLILSLVLVGAAFSTLGYAALWRSKAGLQLRLDRCVESAALELVEIQDGIEAANLRMKIERAAAAAAAAPTLGGSIEAAQPALVAEVAYQEAQRIRWVVRQARWIAERGCDRRSDLLTPLPRLKWTRPVADSLGPQPLEWDGKDTRLEIRLWKTNRISRAKVARTDESTEGEIGDENKDSSSVPSLLSRWKATWIGARTNLD